jgi:hypothetical protein
MKPDEFAAILIEKLEWIRREQEAQEKLDRKLHEVGDSCVTRRQSEIPAAVLGHSFLLLCTVSHTNFC